MSIKSSAFSPTKLTGQDAKKFKDQIIFGRPSQAARDSYARGKELAREFAGKEYARLKPKIENRSQAGVTGMASID